MMRFFIKPNEEAEYPDDKEGLLKAIIADSTNVNGTDPRGKERARAFFTKYFAPVNKGGEGGGMEHPVLGNLRELQHTLQADWNFPLHGVNSVAAILESGLDQLKNPQKPKHLGP